MPEYFTNVFKKVSDGFGAASSVSKTKSENQDIPFTDLDRLVEKSAIIIFETQSVKWLWHPKVTITVCPNRVTITKSSFFGHEECPLQIESITGAKIYQSLVFASLSIDTFGVEEKPEKVRFLRRSDARLVRRYILALIECKKSNIDLSNYKAAELKEKLKTIGMVREGYIETRPL